MPLRYSAEHIRSQPEYQYLTSTDKKQGKVSINLNDHSLRIIDVATTEDSQTSTDLPSRTSTPRSSTFVLQTKPSVTRPRTSSSVSSSKALTRPRTTSLVSSSSSFSLLCPSGDRRGPSVRPLSSISIFEPIKMRGYAITDLRPPSSASVERRQNLNYDPNLDRTKQFLKGCGTAFSQANQNLTPLKRGLRHVEVHYSETNLKQNDTLIFADLIRSAHKSNIICRENVDNLEKRLLRKRQDKNKATTFYDTVLLPPSSLALPRSARARTVAGKNEDRKKRIKKKNQKIEMGFDFEPRHVSLRPCSKEEYQHVLDCRYLRVSPKYQPGLYRFDNFSKDDENLKQDANATS